MKRLLLLLLPLIGLTCTPAHAQSNGDFLFSKVGADGSIEVYLTPNSTDLLGWNGAGAMAQIPRSTFLTPATAASTYQPLSATLTTLSSATAAGLALMDDVDAAAQRSTLGLGTLATQSATIADYLTSATAASTYQPLSATLTTLSSATAAGLALMDDADATAQRTTLGLGAAALLAASTGGNGASDSGQVATYDASGNLTVTGQLNIIDGTGSAYLGAAALSLDDGAGNTAFVALPTGAANLIWPAETGTLVSTGGTSTVTNTMLAGSIANAKLANSAITIAGASTSLGGTVTATTILDSLGSTQGQILYRNATAWVPLAPGTSGQALTSGGAGANPSWATISSGLTIGTTTTSGAASGDILTSDGSLLQKLTPGTGVSTWLATPSSANLATAVTGETGTGALVFGTLPTFFDKITVCKTGESDLGGLETITDPLNPGVRAMYLLPPGNSGRIYFGKSGQTALLNLSHVSGVENFPASLVNTTATFQWIQYGVSQDAFWFRPFNGGFTAEITSGYAFQLRNATTAQQFQVYNTYTSTTNHERIDLGWTSNVAHLWTVKGSGGGTARDLVLGFDSDEKLRINASGTTIGNGGSAISKVKHGVATLVAGTVTVSDSDVIETGTEATSSRVFVQRMTDGGTVSTSYSITRINTTSFTITGLSTDTSVVCWEMINP